MIYKAAKIDHLPDYRPADKLKALIDTRAFYI
jgi:hypothetical protein